MTNNKFKTMRKTEALQPITSLKDRRKDLAIKAMEKLNIDKPYIDAFKKYNTVTFFYQYGGFYIDTEINNTPEYVMLKNKIREIERTGHSTVFAVTYSSTEFGILYSFLLVTNEDVERPRNFLYDLSFGDIFSYVYNKSDDSCSEYGTIGVISCGGGIIRYA